MKRLLSLLLAIVLIMTLSIAAAAENTVTVDFSVFENVNNSYLYPLTELEFNYGTTVLDALRSIESLTVTAKGGYVSKIGDYAEFGHGKYSGWTYYVNSVLVNISAAECKLRQGDKIEWIYKIKDDTTVSTTEQTATLAPSTGAQTNTSVNGKTTVALTTTQPTTAVNTTTAKIATTRRKTTESGVSESATVTAALSYLHDNAASFTPLVFSLYSQPIPKQMRSELIEQAAADSKKPIELERLIINMSAIGESFAEDNLTELLFNSSNIMASGLNSPVFALMAAKHCTFDENTEYKYTVDSLIKIILQNQNDDGGFSLTFDIKSDCDITAMTISALSPYKNKAEVEAAIERAVIWLSANQNDDASFTSSYDEACCESTAQVIIALKTLGIELDDERFVKNNKNTYDALMGFATDKGFSHTKNGKVNAMASEQALLALYANNKGENPYTAAITTHINEINIWLFAAIALGIVVICAVVLLVMKKRKKHGK